MPASVQRFMQLKQVNKYVSKVMAVISTTASTKIPPRGMVLAPADKTEKELVGSYFSNGQWVQSAACPAKKVTLVIPTYSGGSKLDRCLASIRRCHDSFMDYEIIVSFDCGPDPVGTREIATRYGAKFLQRTENGGFSAAVNDGIREADPTAFSVILVNDDLWFDIPACAILAETLEKYQDVGIAGARLLYPDSTIQHGGVAENGFHMGVGLDANDPLVLEERDSWAVTGALYAMSKNLLDKVNGMDTRFRMAWEDTDLCMSARMLGLKIRYVGKAWAFHEEGGTRGRDAATKGKNEKWTRWEEKGGDKFRAKWGDHEDLTFEACKNRPMRTKLQRIVIKRKTAFGDVLLTTPVVNAIRQANPEAEIVVATQHGFIYRDNPDVSYIIGDKHQWVTDGLYETMYDLDLSYEMRPSMGIMQSYEDVCGVKALDPFPRIFLRQNDREFARTRIAPGKKWVVMHAQPSGWPGKDWSGEKFDQVSRALRRRGYNVILVGTGRRLSIGCDVDLRETTSFHQMAAVMELADAYIGKDSLPLHVAQAFKKPIVAIFGSVDPSHILIPSRRSIGITASPGKVDCLGCHHRLPPPRTSGSCHRDRVYCMEELTVDEVVAAFERSIRG